MYDDFDDILRGGGNPSILGGGGNRSILSDTGCDTLDTFLKLRCTIRGSRMENSRNRCWIPIRVVSAGPPPCSEMSFAHPPFLRTYAPYVSDVAHVW